MLKLLHKYSSKPYQFIEHNYLELEKIPLKSLSKRKENIGSMFEKSSLIFKLIYEVKTGRTIKLFSIKFFLKNKRNIQMIIGNKIRNIKYNYITLKKDKRILKIKLMILNNKTIEFNEMFYNCISLKECLLISQNGQNLKNEIKEEQYPYKNDYIELNNLYKNLLNDFSEVNNKSDLTDKNINSLISFRNKLYFIHSPSSEIDISKDQKELISQAFIKSHDYLYTSSSFDSIKFQNNFNEFISSKEYLINQKEVKEIIKVNDENKKIKSTDNIYQYFYDINEKNSIIVSNLSFMFYGCS